MSVYYKFKSAKDFDSIPIEGQFVSVAHLKERIFESKQLGRGTDFDLVVSNAQTDEEYADEAAMIPKNTSVLIRRVPGRRRMPIIAEQVESKGVEDKVVELPPPSNTYGDSSTMRYSEESEYDVFGNDLYAMPETQPARPCNPVVDATPVNMVDEDSKIKELIDSSTIEWNRPMQDAYGAGRGFGRGMGGRMMGGRGRGFGFGRGGLQGNTPPQGYICHRCKVPGHFIQHCPTNGDPNFDVRRVKPPTGIPRSMLMATPDGSYALPSGAVAVLKPNEAAFEKEIEGLPTTRPVGDLPQELRCPLCKEVMKDAVLTSKCCFRTFCYKCIRDYIITKSMCVCGVANVLVDDLVPNYTLRETISHLLESTSSAENGGSFVQAQDMESARQGQPKLLSPTASATSKDEAGQPSKGYSIDTKEIERTSGENLANAVVNSVDKKAVQNEDPSGATPESASAKEVISPEGALVADELQDKLLAGDQGKKKKKKKTRVPVSGATADMQWRGYQDFGTENYTGMPVGPSAFNPYWGGGMPLGMDPYMSPYGGGMPYMGYAPGPFDIPYGGMLPQDPFASQGYMMPPGFPQRDLSELGSGNMAMNHGPPIMSREEFEARKADLRRKRDMENLSERDRSRERGDRGRETSNGRDVLPSKAKPVRPFVDSFSCTLRFINNSWIGQVIHNEQFYLGEFVLSSVRALLWWLARQSALLYLFFLCELYAIDWLYMLYVKGVRSMLNAPSSLFGLALHSPWIVLRNCKSMGLCRGSSKRGTLIVVSNFCSMVDAVARFSFCLDLVLVVILQQIKAILKSELARGQSDGAIKNRNSIF